MNDDVIPVEYGRETYSLMRTKGFNVERYEQTRLGHSIDANTIRVMAEWTRPLIKLASDILLRT